MRDCVLWNIKREQDKMHRKYGAPAVGACQGHILQETILWLSGYQRQTFHFITGAWGINIMTKSSKFLNWLIAHLCYLTRFETTNWNSWNIMCLICNFINPSFPMLYYNVIFCPARGLDQLLHRTLGAGRHLLTFLSRSRNLRTRWGSFLQHLSTLCEKVYSSRLKCWRGFKLFEVSAHKWQLSPFCVASLMFRKKLNLQRSISFNSIKVQWKMNHQGN